jgi:hypothetical protein
MDNSFGQLAFEGVAKWVMILACFAVLGVWKLVEIIIWLVNHLSIGLR